MFCPLNTLALLTYVIGVMVMTRKNEVDYYPFDFDIAVFLPGIRLIVRPSGDSWSILALDSALYLHPVVGCHIA